MYLSFRFVENFVCSLSAEMIEKTNEKKEKNV